MSVLSDIVAKFRTGSPNIAAAFDEVERRLVALETPAPPPPPPPPPPSELPFQEAQLRTGFQSVTIPAAATSYTPPTTADYLIDLGWTVRSRRLLIYGRAGQRIKIVNGYWDVSGTLPVGGSAYGFGGIGFRAADATGAEHISLTNALITGNILADGIVIDSGNNTRITIQKVRIESSSLVTGSVAQWGLNGSPAEHLDALQIQGPCGPLEIGQTTIYACSVQSGNHGGKGLMLGMHWGSVPVSLNKVNFRDSAGLGGVGAFIFQDSVSLIPITLTDVYAWKQATTPPWANGSGMFVSYQNSQQWYSTGTAPNRVANFYPSQAITGIVREGLPATGRDYVTRADLGLA